MVERNVFDDIVQGIVGLVTRAQEEKYVSDDIMELCAPTNAVNVGKGQLGLGWVAYIV